MHLYRPKVGQKDNSRGHVTTLFFYQHFNSKINNALRDLKYWLETDKSSPKVSMMWIMDTEK